MAHIGTIRVEAALFQGNRQLPLHDDAMALSQPTGSWPGAGETMCSVDVIPLAR
jgi:hypothetical protein